MAKPRNYRHEYDRFHKSKRSKLDRASRNTARAAKVRSGAATKGDGQDVHHADGNPRNNSSSNLRMATPAKNRAANRRRKKITAKKAPLKKITRKKKAKK